MRRVVRRVAGGILIRLLTRRMPVVGRMLRTTLRHRWEVELKAFKTTVLGLVGLRSGEARSTRGSG
jgi:hypothetical protein